MNGRRWILAFGVLLLAGAGCIDVRSVLRRPQARPAGPIRCEYEGRSFAAGEQRHADDGCNVCTCSENGWECTTLRCVAGTGATGTISGSVSHASGGASSQIVCAAPRQGGEICLQTVREQTFFSLRVPVGRYAVYAMRADDVSKRKAWWSEFVKCGGAAECKDHSPIEFDVASGASIEANPQDWSAPSWIESVYVTPSKRLDNAYFLKRGANLTVRGRELTDVSFTYKTYPPGENSVIKELGKAVLQVTEEGLQKWVFPVPPGFEATDVTVRGLDAAGNEFRWPGLGYFRWGDLPPDEEESKWMKP